MRSCEDKLKGKTAHFRLPSASQKRAYLSSLLIKTRTATGSERFSFLTCLHTTAFALTSIFSPLEMLGIKIWKTPLSWHAKCPLPVVVRVSKTCMLKLPNDCENGRLTFLKNTLFEETIRFGLISNGFQTFSRNSLFPAG